MIEIKCRFTGKVLLSIDKPNLIGANLYGANLYGANLYGADLTGANLIGADLSRANLSGANLSRANLIGANLSGANLYGANLYGADLTGANMSRADLSRADLSRADLRCFGDMVYIKTMQIESWSIGYTSKILQIGCQVHTIKEWMKYDDETISDMESSALSFWVRFKPIIKSLIDTSPAKDTGYDNTKS